ncbi:MAG TPA: 30S ribosomal protein S19 [archaeon]|nr:30S ribosomal protein S19 [uncultured archaeon]HZX33947.1 30S ribosomal protein S19 [archaeon]
MAKGEYSFRGKTMEELKNMGIEEFAKLCTSRVRKSLLKGVDKKFMKKVAKAKEVLASGKYPKPVRTHNRDYIVVPEMMGITIAVYNGHEFQNVEIKEKMLGHYFGEFALTRKKLTHGKAGIGATRSSTAITARG